MIRERNMAAPNISSKRVDIGLLLLRGAGLLLALTFGWQKLFALALSIHAGQPLASAGLAPLIQRIGVPLPTLAAIFVAFSESIAALFVGLGLFTRVAATCLTLSMAGALYFSLHVVEEPLRAALYLIIFAALVVSGPGRYSIDGLMQSRNWIREKPSRTGTNGALEPRSGVGFLALRLGVGISFVLLFGLKQSHGARVFAGYQGHTWPLILLSLGAAFVVFETFGRPIAVCMALAWAWALFSGVRYGEPFYGEPLRSALFSLIFLVLGVAGPGKFSIDHWMKGRSAIE